MNNNEEPNPNAQARPEELPDNEPAPEAEAEEAEEVPVNPPPFALNPGQAHLKLLDYRTRKGVKYYQRATATLYKERHFDVEADQLNNFLRCSKSTQRSSDGSTMISEEFSTSP